jgi:hypothetical protein
MLRLREPRRRKQFGNSPAQAINRCFPNKKESARTAILRFSMYEIEKNFGRA